ncbi:phosphoribosylformylglycinamidine synthase [Rhinatrema bivittatum]|uniref:phosphoribosylformylglycinamidine synthase n=1 Tax=Rhinatrema bivittatum TaxID=194408 RepID=UPI00112E1A03|nr:phosphoribosylformylglycinamidine synthase [Rhinatrema bivittatum]
MVVLRFFKMEADGRRAHLKANVGGASENILSMTRELCFNVNWTGDSPPDPKQIQIFRWLFSCPFDPEGVSSTSYLALQPCALLVEIGPRLNFSTATSTNAVSICRGIGLGSVDRIEFSRRYLIKFAKSPSPSEEQRVVSSLYDRMTECVYERPIESFLISTQPEPVHEVDVIGEGCAALEKANRELGLAFDSWDLDFYTSLFQRVQRNPTSVECFDLAQSNSEHSRHWFFKGRLQVDGEVKSESLFNMIMKTQESSNPNNVIKFCDNSSGIQGKEVQSLFPMDPSRAGPYRKWPSKRHVIFTAETHNFPTGVAPFSGATTGTGGRIRDVQCTGRGAHVIAGTAGYCFGNLHIPDYSLPWEDPSFQYPENFARPLEVAIEASNGASDYGNKFGEPVLAGFARSFGLQMPGGERKEWIKPIMFSGGVGSMEDSHVKKELPKSGMQVVKVGGPVYRIGVGGGAASSVQVQGDNASELDFGAVQRGDAEMEQKMNRAVRACIERGGKNPICSIHDQGAGGNGNVLKELSEPAGAVIYARDFQLGDPTLSLLEIWGAEYQESNALLVHPQDEEFLRRVCRREKCPVDFVGRITGDGRIVLVDGSAQDSIPDLASSNERRHPVDLQLEWVLGKMPCKDFTLNRVPPAFQPLTLPSNLTVLEALHRVLKLPSVGSKRYLTNKVDRSVTGLVAQQQCVGPLHTPLADVAVVALSYFEKVGAATAIGEQPIKGLLDPAAGARMAVGEALTNLMFAEVTDLKDVKCSGNWMWAAKLPGEGAALHNACAAMCRVMAQLGIAVDGGKDSLSMAARVGTETVKAPGSLVISVYAVCPDITATVTPDLKNPDGKGVLLYVRISSGRYRLGGSALAQCYSQLGDQSPDLDSPETLRACFNVTQQLLRASLLTSGHDVSDGGLVTCFLEMAFAGNYGIEVDVPAPGASGLQALFSEELGLVLEVAEAVAGAVCEAYQDAGVECIRIGRTLGRGPCSMVRVCVNGHEVLQATLAVLRGLWESTSFQLERLQANPDCVSQEEEGLARREGPSFQLTFNPAITQKPLQELGLPRPLVAVLREEGSNGDREMAACLFMAGFEVWDVTMQDLCSGDVTLDVFRGLVFVGGFSYADVLGSAKGWAASVLYNAAVRAQFKAFKQRTDTFSLGVCNGCQLMALLGWVVPGKEEQEDSANTSDDDGDVTQGVLLSHNLSGRFESRFISVGVLESPSILLRGMAGSTLGVWVAHGEGHMRFHSKKLLHHTLSCKLAPLRYVDDAGIPTEEYPLNPNGSPLGIAGLCSLDGRHLALMPHPERCVMPWQWPWMPLEWRRELTVSPWMRLFQNAFAWCLQDTGKDSHCVTRVMEGETCTENHLLH